MGPRQSPTNRELIILALTQGGPMKPKEIFEWLESRGPRTLTHRQVRETLGGLKMNKQVVSGSGRWMCPRNVRQVDAIQPG